MADRPAPRFAAEGRLLAHCPPAIVGIGSQLFEVVSRTTGEGPAGPYVIYRCSSGDRTCNLSVELAGNDTIAAIRLSYAEASVQLSEDDIEVYGGQFNRCPPASQQNIE